MPPKKKRGRPPKITPEDHFQKATQATQDISTHYSMSPTEQRLAFLYALELDPKAIIVEIGVLHGKTGCLLAYAAKERKATYVGIDNFSLEGNYASTTKNFTDRSLPATILEGNAYEVTWHQPIDYLLIDGGHDRINMSNDTHRWLPLLKPGGLVLFHAYNPDIDASDPHFPVKEFAQLHTHTWKTVEFIPYLLIKRKPKIITNH